MILHKLLTGDGAGTYLPFGLARLRALERVYGSTGFFQQKYRVPGFEIEVKQDPPYQYITIRAAGMYFEFATSGYPVVQTTFNQESNPFPTYKGCIVGVEIGSSSGGMTLSPTIRGQKRTISGTDVSLIGRAYQAQLVNEPIAYQKAAQGSARYPVAVYESWAPGNPHTGVPIRDTELVIGSAQFFTGPTETYTVRDRLFDVPFQYGVNKSKVKTAYLRGTRDWPRASGIQTVTDDRYGTRTFAIYIDGFSQFSAFPVDSIETLNGVTQNVVEDAVVTVAPAFPAWCYKPTTKLKDYAGSAFEGLLDFPELDWKLNHKGTKAATIVYERLPYENDVAYWAADASAQPFTQAYFDDMANKMGVLGRDTQYNVMPGYNNDRHFIAPGIIEASIKITLTGVNPHDFTLAVTITELRRPLTMNRWSLAVGYVWHDIQKTPKTNPPTFLVRAGDLISLDHELWAVKFGNLSDWIIATFSAPQNPLLSLLSWRRLKSDVVAPGVWLDDHIGNDNEIQCRIEHPVLALDMTTFSCVLEATSLVGFNSVVDLYGPGSDDQLFGAAVVVKGRLKEILLPKTAATAEGQSLAAHKANMRELVEKDGRKLLNDLIAVDARWQRILTTPADGDGWSNSAFASVRDGWARGNNDFHFTPAGNNGSGFPYGGQGAPFDVYKTGSAPADSPAILSAKEDLYSRWLTSRFDNLGALFVCREPKWGWHMYASYAADIMWLSPEVTFFVHPGGSWAYWDNVHVYVPHPFVRFVPGGPGGYTSFDPAAVEHVIFDRVHLQQGASFRDTTFFDLYNKAVSKGKAANTLQTGIDAMTAENMRASFGKFPSLQPTVVFSHTYISTYLSLVAQWDGGTWFKPDTLYVDDATPFNNLRLPPGGAMSGLRFDQAWYTLPYFDGAREYPSLNKPHVRVANPVLLGA